MPCTSYLVIDMAYINPLQPPQNSIEKPRGEHLAWIDGIYDVRAVEFIRAQAQSCDTST